MKNQTSKNKLRLMLNKKTIANLNPLEMVHVGSGEMGQPDDSTRVKETDPSVCQLTYTPVTTDFGITPGIRS
jgi:hypothetical protein